MMAVDAAVTVGSMAPSSDNVGRSLQFSQAIITHLLTHGAFCFLFRGQIRFVKIFTLSKRHYDSFSQT